MDLERIFEMSVGRADARATARDQRSIDDSWTSSVEVFGKCLEFQVKLPFASVVVPELCRLNSLHLSSYLGRRLQ